MTASMKDLRQIAVTDQLEGAIVQANKVISSTAEVTGRPLDTNHSLATRELIGGWLGDLKKLRACQHVVSSPTVVFGYLHQPGYVFCSPCLLKFVVEDTKNRPNECDACEATVSIFNEIMLQFGAILLCGNICEACHAKYR